MSTETSAPKKPIRMAPIVSAESKFFWDAADRGEFVAQRCGDCGLYSFPPRPMCPQCHSLKREVVALSGKGEVLSWTVPRHPPAFGFLEPPIVAVIKLAEGINFVSNVNGVALDEMRVGLPVEVRFEPTMGNHQVPVFQPAAR